MQAGRVRDQNRWRTHYRFPGIVGCVCSALECYVENRILSCSYVACTYLEVAHESHVGDNDLSQQTPGMDSNIVSVKVDQHITTSDRFTRLYSGSKTVAFKHYCVETDVHEHFDTFRCCDRHCMSRRVNLRNSSVTR